MGIPLKGPANKRLLLLPCRLAKQAKNERFIRILNPRVPLSMLLPSEELAKVWQKPPSVHLQNACVCVQPHTSTLYQVQPASGAAASHVATCMCLERGKAATESTCCCMLDTLASSFCLVPAGSHVWSSQLKSHCQCSAAGAVAELPGPY